MFSSLEYYQKHFALLFTKYPHNSKIGFYKYLLFLIFSRIITKVNHSYAIQKTVKIGLLGFLRHQLHLHNTHSWMGMSMALATVSAGLDEGGESIKLQIILNWTHMLCICGSRAFGTCHINSSSNVGENDFSPSSPMLQKNHHDCSSLVLYFVGGERFISNYFMICEKC